MKTQIISGNLKESLIKLMLKWNKLPLKVGRLSFLKILPFCCLQEYRCEDFVKLESLFHHAKIVIQEREIFGVLNDFYETNLNYM